MEEVKTTIDQDQVAILKKPWSVPQLAEFLDMSPLTVYRLIRLGQLPAVKLGRRVFIPYTVVESLSNGR